MNNSAAILRNDSADILAFGSGVGGLGLRRGGRHLRIYRDFVASSGGWLR